MKRTMMWVVAMVITAVPPVAQGKAPCQSIPTQVTVSPADNFGITGSISSAIQPDSGGPYVDAVNGVAATIDSCSGSYDLLLNLAKSSRSITIRLADVVGAASPDMPGWVSSPVPIAFLNIRNLFYGYSQDSTYSFTTRLILNLAGVASGYSSGLVNPTDQAYPAPPINPEMNDPITTSDVIVWHYAANSNSYTVETWVAYPDTSQMDPNTANAFYVGGLIKTVKGTTVSAGQYSIPFQITIQHK